MLHNGTPTAAEAALAGDPAIEDPEPAVVRQRGDRVGWLVAELVERAREGDRASMAELYRRFARMIHAILLARVPPHDADDLAQDVFVQAITRLESLHKPDAFGSWIAMIARNAATDLRRRSRPQVELEEHADPEPGADKKLGAKQVLKAIRRLPGAYQEVLLMRLVEGMTGPEIAERAGLTPGSVRVNLHRGMQLLKAELAEARP